MIRFGLENRVNENRGMKIAYENRHMEPPRVRRRRTSTLSLVFTSWFKARGHPLPRIRTLF